MSEDLSVYKEAKSIGDFRKLIGESVPVEIYLEEPKVDDQGKEIPRTPIRAFLRALTYNETLYVRQAILEQYAYAKDNGFNLDVANRIANESMFRHTIYYATKQGWELNSPRLFHLPDEVAILPGKTVIDLYVTYTKSFDISTADLGESLRARTSGTK